MTTDIRQSNWAAAGILAALIASRSTPVAAQALDDALTGVTIVNSVDVSQWPVTASITGIAVTPNNIIIDFTKKSGANRWPDQPFGLPADQGNLQYTVWLLLNINDHWYASGFIQMWYGREGVGDSFSDFAKNWYYSNRWGPMLGHQIADGETVGFMVTAGDARNNAISNVRERSNVVTIPATNGVYVFDSTAANPPAPPVPVPMSPTFDLEEAIHNLRVQADANTAKIQQQIDQAITNLEKSVAPFTKLLGK